MANSKLVIIEGAQGCGKTSTTDFIRSSMSYTNLYRLCGTSDRTKTGYDKAKEMYAGLLNYIETLQNKSVNLLFDRTFFTEEIYCRLGKKEYSFTDVYNDLVARLNDFDFDIYYITLYLSDTSLFEERLFTGDRKEKAKFAGSEFDVNNSISQQNAYLELANEIKENYSNIKVYNVANDGTFDELKDKLRDILQF